MSIIPQHIAELSLRNTPDAPYANGMGRRIKPIPPAFALSLLPKIAARLAVDPVTDCWIWQGATTGSGYGQVTANSLGHYLVHRVMYAACYGTDIPDGMVIDHRCLVKTCANPLHIRVATNRENTLVGTNIAAQNATRTHCPRGDLLEGDNLRRSVERKGGRNCKVCDDERYSLIKTAHTILGMKRDDYADDFGWSRATASYVVQLALFAGRLRCE